MKRTSLQKVESLLRRVFEEPFSWIGSAGLDPFQLAMYLARSYEGHDSGEAYPNHFLVSVSVADYRAIEPNLPELSRQVGEYTALLAERLGHAPAEIPRVTFKADPEVVGSRARVVARYDDTPDVPRTEVLAVEPSEDVDAAIRNTDAFLIIQGRRHVSLDRPIIHLGRRIDNDIVIDDASVSRRHAQIRWRQHFFVLYDVSNRSQTWVNGVPVMEQELRSGDVIGLGDVLIVYGEGRDNVAERPPVVNAEDLGTTLLNPEV